MQIRQANALALAILILGAGMAASATAAGRSIVILGASYAQAWGTPPLPGYNHVINRGVGGEETGDMLKRFASDVVAARPDAVLIWGHVNNITRSPPDRIEAAKAAALGHYAEMLRQARSAGIEVIFATEVPWTEPGGFMNALRGWVGWLRGKESYAARTSAHVHQVNEQLRKLARSEGCLLLDFEGLFANTDGTRKTEYAAEDASHISPAGYEALTAYTRKELGRVK